MNLKGWRIEKDDYDNESTLRNGCVVDDEQIGGDQEDAEDVAHLKKDLVPSQGRPFKKTCPGLFFG